MGGPWARASASKWARFHPFTREEARAQAGSKSRHSPLTLRRGNRGDEGARREHRVFLGETLRSSHVSPGPAVSRGRRFSLRRWSALPSPTTTPPSERSGLQAVLGPAAHLQGPVRAFWLESLAAVTILGADAQLLPFLTDPPWGWTPIPQPEARQPEAWPGGPQTHCSPRRSARTCSRRRRPH